MHCNKHLCEKCIFSHNQNEIDYHPLVYKTKICNEINCENLYCSKEKLISYFKNIVYHKSNVQCPLNGKDCNYNRTKRF